MNQVKDSLCRLDGGPEHGRLEPLKRNIVGWDGGVNWSGVQYDFSHEEDGVRVYVWRSPLLDRLYDEILERRDWMDPARIQAEMERIVAHHRRGGAE